MAQALLAVYDSVKQQQPQQGDGAGSSAAAAAAGSSVAAAAAAGEEPPLLPKQAFILQLVKECCGPAGALKGEKVVVFSQVSGVVQCLHVSSWLAGSRRALKCVGRVPWHSTPSTCTRVAAAGLHVDTALYGCCCCCRSCVATRAFLC